MIIVIIRLINNYKIAKSSGNASRLEKSGLHASFKIASTIGLCGYFLFDHIMWL
jgi:hypothetical protein